jgi:dihydroceramide fatty acyl 2-hydroxylase
MGTSKWGLSKVGYYADFLIVPSAAAAIAAEAALRDRVTISWLALAVVGFVLWTLIEYAVHRFVFHGSNDFAVEHDKHHKHEAEYIGWSSLVTGVLFAAGYAALLLTAGAASGGAIAVGLLFGYLSYIVVHDRVHHSVIGRGSWLYRLKLHHVGHHRGVLGNYGVTTRLWDALFGTLTSSANWNPRTAERV